MNLGIIFGIGESFKQISESGQQERFIKSFITPYSKVFKKIYVFSYENENVNVKLPSNVILVSKGIKVHRYLYAILLPIIHREEFSNCDVVRGFGLVSSVSSFLLNKPFVFNWAYDYRQFLLIDKKYFLIPIFKLLERLAFIRADKVLVATKQKLNKVKGQKFIYSSNGVDVNIFNQKKINGKGLVFVGRFEEQKNLFFLLDSVSLLPAKLRFITFVGSGSQEKALKRYAAKKKVKLIIIPPMPNSDLPKLLNHFSIFTLPSFAEGIPKVLLEAMASGLVPVVTEFPTAKEVIKDGLDGYITPFDKYVYTQRLQTLLEDDSLRSKISKKSKLKIENKFNLQHVITNEIKVLKEVAS